MTPSANDPVFQYQSPEDLYYAMQETGIWDFFVEFDPKPEEVADPELRALVKAAKPLVAKLERIFDGILDRCEPADLLDDEEVLDGKSNGSSE